MATFELNPNNFPALAAGSFTAKKEWVDGKAGNQLIDDETKFPVWNLKVLLTLDGTVSEQTVTVPFPEEPVFSPFTKLAFTKPSISPRTFGDAGFTLKAAGVKALEEK